MFVSILMQQIDDAMKVAYRAYQFTEHRDNHPPKTSQFGLSAVEWM